MRNIKPKAKRTAHATRIHSARKHTLAYVLAHLANHKGGE